MAKVQLQSSLEYRKNSKVILPIVGEAKFDANGVIEVDVTGEELNHLLTSLEDLSIVGEEIKKQVVENDLGKSTDEGNDIGGTEGGDPLGQLDFVGLQEVAIQGGFDKKEWKKLDEAGLREYLIKQLQAQ